VKAGGQCVHVEVWKCTLDPMMDFTFLRTALKKLEKKEITKGMLEVDDDESNGGYCSMIASEGNFLCLQIAGRAKKVYFGGSGQIVR
jgi:hypothetical protein